MTLIRPELLAAAHRGREVIAALVLTGFGAWVAFLGGYLLLPLGGVIVALGLGWTVVSLRRLRFQQAGKPKVLTSPPPQCLKRRSTW